MILNDFNLEYLSNIMNLFKQKRKKLDDMLNITNSQTNAIVTEETDLMEQLISEKQSCINSVDMLNEKLKTLINDLKINLGINSLDQLIDCDTPEIQELKELVSDISCVLEKIEVLEKQNSEMMRKLLDKKRQQIKDIAQGKKALTAYSKNYLKSSHYFNKNK